MKVVLTLKILRDYYENNQFLERWLSTTQKNAAEFKTLIGDIDHWLSFWYCTEYVKTERNSTEFPYYVASWWDLRINDFNKVYTAMLEDYDALADFWEKEHSGNSHDIADTLNVAQNSGTLKQQYAKRTSTDSTSTNTDVSDGDAKFDNKTVTEVGETGEGKLDGDVTTDGRAVTTTNGFREHNKTVTIGEETLTGAEVNEFYKEKEGNRGDKTIQEVLEKELQIRKQSFIRYFGECFETECLTGLFQYGEEW